MYKNAKKKRKRTTTKYCVKHINRYQAIHAYIYFGFSIIIIKALYKNT